MSGQSYIKDWRGKLSYTIDLLCSRYFDLVQMEQITLMKASLTLGVPVNCAFYAITFQNVCCENGLLIHFSIGFNDIFKCVKMYISCSVLLSCSVLFSPIFQVSA